MLTRITLVLCLFLAMTAAAMADERQPSRHTYRSLSAGNGDQLAQQPVAAKPTVIKAAPLVGDARPVTATTTARTSDLRSVAAPRAAVSAVAAVRPMTAAVAAQPADANAPIVVNSRVQPDNQPAYDNNARIVGNYQAAYQPATVAQQPYVQPAYYYGPIVSAPVRTYGPSYHYPTGYYGHSTVFYSSGASCYTPATYCPPRYSYPTYSCAPRYYSSYRPAYYGGGYYGGGSCAPRYYGGNYTAIRYSYSSCGGSRFGISIGF